MHRHTRHRLSDATREQLVDWGAQLVYPVLGWGLTAILYFVILPALHNQIVPYTLLSTVIVLLAVLLCVASIIIGGNILRNLTAEAANLWRHLTSGDNACYKSVVTKEAEKKQQKEDADRLLAEQLRIKIAASKITIKELQQIFLTLNKEEQRIFLLGQNYGFDTGFKSGCDRGKKEGFKLGLQVKKQGLTDIWLPKANAS